MDGEWVRLVFDQDVPFETIEYWCGYTWEKQPPRMLKDLSSKPLGPITIQAGRHAAQPRRLDRLRDVHLVWSNFFISGNRCTSIYYDDPRVAVSGIVNWPGLSKLTGVFRHGNDFVTPRSRLQNVEHIGGRTMLASSDEPHNWGMYLLYVLPAVNHFIENRHLYDRLLVYAGHPNMWAILEFLGLTAADVILHDYSRAYHFECIDLFRQPRREFHVGPQAKSLVAKLREKIAGSTSIRTAHHIYAGRRRRTVEQRGYRALINEPELIGRLVTMGYRPVDPEYLSPKGQIELFGSKRNIVVLGGAGLFNAVFCQPGTKAIDIESSRDHIENHSTILSSMECDYGIILGQIDRSDPAPHNKRWTVNVEEAALAIAEFMS